MDSARFRSQIAISCSRNAGSYGSDMPLRAHALCAGADFCECVLKGKSNCRAMATSFAEYCVSDRCMNDVRRTHGLNDRQTSMTQKTD